VRDTNAQSVNRLFTNTSPRPLTPPPTPLNTTNSALTFLSEVHAHLKHPFEKFLLDVVLLVLVLLMALIEGIHSSVRKVFGH